MKKYSFTISYLILVILLTGLGCVEYGSEKNYQLSSDFTIIERNTIFFINDSNLTLFYKCDKENIYYGLYNKFTVKGNITNTGTNTIQFCAVNASFYDRKKNNPSFSTKDVESYEFWTIEPNQTVNFSIEKKYRQMINLRYYKINTIYFI